MLHLRRKRLFVFSRPLSSRDAWLAFTGSRCCPNVTLNEGLCVFFHNELLLPWSGKHPANDGQPTLIYGSPYGPRTRRRSQWRDEICPGMRRRLPAMPQVFPGRIHQKSPRKQFLLGSRMSGLRGGSLRKVGIWNPESALCRYVPTRFSSQLAKSQSDALFLQHLASDHGELPPGCPTQIESSDLQCPFCKLW